MSFFLIADDNGGKTLMLRALVKKSGFDGEVLTAATTDEAKTCIDEHAVSYAFIDYEMPTEDGPAVIRYLKEICPNAKIALVSSSNSERYQKEATEAGAEAYICTSFQSDEVEESILNLLDEWRNP